VEPEFIDSVEVGFKSRWLDDRVVISAAAFRYWYEDLQVFDIINEAGQLPLQQLLNSDARVWGAELEFQIRPLEGLLFQGGVGWLDTEFIDFNVTKVTASGGIGGTKQAEFNFDYSGNPLIAAPEWSVSGVVEYQYPLSRWGTLVPQYDFSYRTKVYLDAQASDPISQDAYILHNARLSYRTRDGRLEVAGWVRNFMDKYYKVDAFDFSRDFNTILEVWGDPRTYGFTVTYAW
jgi:iron complex outermembrane receptor protein